jgi:hypothetical protein
MTANDKINLYNLIARSVDNRAINKRWYMLFPIFKAFKFKVEIRNKGCTMFVTNIVMAINNKHAMKLLYYKYGMGAIQSNINKYTAK